MHARGYLSVADPEHPVWLVMRAGDKTQLLSREEERVLSAVPRDYVTDATKIRLAVGMAEGPEAGLALIAALEESGRLAGYHLLPATKADMYRRLGRADEAAACYREALGLAGTKAERSYLRRRLAETGSG